LKTEIILIRHGETEWNAVRRLQGHTDIVLNAEGERQAAALGVSLQQERLVAIISSDLQRAKQTAKAVANWHGLPVQIDPALRERCFGGFEGLKYDEIVHRYPAEFAAWQAREPDVMLPKDEAGNAAETFRQFYHRCLQAFETWAKRYPGQTIALVAHGGVLECAYLAACEIPLGTARNFQVFNASVNRLSWEDGKLSLRVWGDCAHLETVPMNLNAGDGVAV
jgi:probable phosphoglycerate mutase